MASIRGYEEKDLEPVVAVFRSNVPKYFGTAEEPRLREFLAEMRSENYYVIECKGEIIGAGGIALNDDDTVSLCWGMIREDHLGTGLGGKLTEFRIEASVKRFGNRAMVLNTSQHTEGFYRKFGFRTVKHTADGFGPGLDICKMQLDAISR